MIRELRLVPREDMARRSRGHACCAARERAVRTSSDSVRWPRDAFLRHGVPRVRKGGPCVPRDRSRGSAGGVPRVRMVAARREARHFRRREIFPLPVVLRTRRQRIEHGVAGEEPVLRDRDKRWLREEDSCAASRALPGVTVQRVQTSIRGAASFLPGVASRLVYRGREVVSREAIWSMLCRERALRVGAARHHFLVRRERVNVGAASRALGCVVLRAFAVAARRSSGCREKRVHYMPREDAIKEPREQELQDGDESQVILVAAKNRHRRIGAARRPVCISRWSEPWNKSRPGI